MTPSLRPWDSSNPASWIAASLAASVPLAQASATARRAAGTEGYPLRSADLRASEV